MKRPPSLKPSRFFIYLLLILSLLVCGRQAFPQTPPARAGDLDPTFGTGGKVTVSLLPNAVGNFGARAVITPNGKIYQFGSTGDTISRAGIIRLDERGVLDPTWDGDGIVVAGFPGLTFSRFAGGAVQPDGKVLAGGSATINSINYCFLARFLPNGQVDTTFNGTGYVLFRNPESVQINFYWASVAVQSDGRIVASGAINYQMGAARFNSDGTLDQTFGTGGYRIIQVSLLGELWDMKLAPDDKIVLGGKAMTNFNNANFSDYMLIRLTANGDFDPTFGGGTGYRRLDLTPETESDAEVINGVQLLPDGKILAVGRTGNASDNPIDAVVMRFKPDGGFDNFGTDGKGYLFVDYNGESNLPQDLAVQADGKIVIASFKGQDGNFLVQRLLPDGQFDPSFGIGGSVETDLDGKDYPYSVSLTSDKILLAGYCGRNAASIQKMCLVRYLQNGQSANTAALRGRAVNLLGRGIGGAQITVRNAANNQTQTVPTDRTGIFQLPAMPLGQQYLITVQARRCYFHQMPLVINFIDPNAVTTLRANCFYPIK